MVDEVIIVEEETSIQIVESPTSVKVIEGNTINSYQITVSATAPANPYVNQLWFDIS